MRLILGLCLLGGCSVVYDNQYDDRAGELEELRREVFPAEQKVQRIESGGDRLYWVDNVKPEDENVLHSFVPPNGPVTDYEWSRNVNEVEEFHFGSELVVQCDSSTQAYNVNGSITPRGTTSNGGRQCAVDGAFVYFLFGRRLDKWTPAGMSPASPPVTLIDFDVDDTGIAASLQGFDVIGNTAVAVESGGDLYTINLTTKKATYLGNRDSPATGNIFFDERGVVFDSLNTESPRYIDFATQTETSLPSMVADGGYHLSFKHGDIQVPAGDSEYVIHGKHIIYRGQRGIFAYGLETRNVVDLLLDRGEGIDTEVEYHSPTVTSGGFLYVRSGDLFSNDGPVYEVDLNGRLK